MADKKAKKNNKSIAAIACGVVVVIIVVIIAAVMLATNGGAGAALNDDYFKSDDTKYVLTIETDEETLDSEDSTFTPLKTHIVYTYSDDTITGIKSYYEYADNDAAKAAYDAIKEAGVEITVELNGKYVIMTADAAEYEGVSASDIKQQIELMEMIKNGGFEESTEVEEVEETN